MAINMSYCRVRNVREAIAELNEQLQSDNGLSEEEFKAVRLLHDEVWTLNNLLDDVYLKREDDE